MEIAFLQQAATTAYCICLGWSVVWDPQPQQAHCKAPAERLNTGSAPAGLHPHVPCLSELLQGSPLVTGEKETYCKADMSRMDQMNRALKAPLSGWLEQISKPTQHRQR